MMRGNKKLLLGISIILFGCAIACSGGGYNTMIDIGWGISLFGLIVSTVGYFSEDN
jgi:hypothetical protein